jgi:hypothetical protein
VTIQYSSSPAGYLNRITTKNSGSAIIIQRWLGSALALISSVEPSCEAM